MRDDSSQTRRRIAAAAAVAFGAAAVALAARAPTGASPAGADHGGHPSGLAFSPAAATPATAAAAAFAAAPPRAPAARSSAPALVGVPRPRRAWSPQALRGAAIVSQFIRLGSCGATPAARSPLLNERAWPPALAPPRRRCLVWLRPATVAAGRVVLVVCLDERSLRGPPSRRRVQLLFTVETVAGCGGACLISAVTQA